MGKNKPGSKKQEHERAGTAAIGTSRIGNKYYNPTTGKEETKEKQTARNKPGETFTTGAGEVSKEEFQREKYSGRKTGETEEQAAQRGIKDIAQRSLDIEGAKENIKTEKFIEEREAKKAEDGTIEETEQISEEKGLLGQVGDVVGDVFGPIGGFKELEEEGRLHAGQVPIGPTPTAINLIQGITEKTIAKMTTHVPQTGATITVNGVTKNVADISRTYNWARVTNNAKNYALKTSYLTKLAAATKNPALHLGILGSVLYTSLFWAQNEKGDALTTSAIVQANAAKNGQWDKVYEIDEIIQETLNITAGVPFIGFWESEWAKFAAAGKASEVYVEQANKATGQLNQGGQ